MLEYKLLRWIGPGILVAATGVGAGDLATASFAGGELGLAALWAVVVGVSLKFVLNEGLTRWQLATGTTLIEGVAAHLGRVAQLGFLVYLIVWTFLVGAALMSAAGVVGHAIWPLAGAESPQTDKVVYGIAHSLLALVLVQLGGYRLLERLIQACIVAMFVGVVVTAVAMRPPTGEFLSGLLVPTIPSGGVLWTVALMGGIGGTVTVLCYGYWIREAGRQGIEQLSACRIDLATAYAMTALFGLAMVVIGASLGPIEGGGATLMVRIASRLQDVFGTAGPLAKWAFLAGAWAAIFSSMLGVWQSTPYLFADLWQLMRDDPRHPVPVDTQSTPYRAYLYAIALVPIVGLTAVEFRSIQKWYAVVGALFIPMLAGVLLYLNGTSRWIGEKHKNSRAATFVLVGALLLFTGAASLEIYDNLFAGRP